jgi:hypothetical protein
MNITHIMNIIHAIPDLPFCQIFFIFFCFLPPGAGQQAKTRPGPPFFTPALKISLFYKD